jgi:uncharacterized hydrophobic protein (TIGR00271 family)
MLETVKKYLNIFRLPAERHKRVIDQVNENAKGDLDFFVLTIFAAIIISLGLIINNGAVIIGGMLMAPFVWPILALAMAMIRGSLRTLEQSIVTIVKSAVLILISSYLLGLISPFHQFGTELFSRTQPTIVELFIALASGFVAAFVIGYPGLGSFIAGVVIASAVVPPLCVTGLLLAEKDLNGAAGSLLLFTANLIAMILSAVLYFALAKFKPVATEEGQERRTSNLIWSLIFMVIIAIPLIIITGNIIRDNNRLRVIKQVVYSYIKDSEVYNINLANYESVLFIEVSIRSKRNLTPIQMENLSSLLSEKLDNPVNLKMTIIPVLEAGGGYDFNNFEPALNIGSLKEDVFPKIKDMSGGEVSN